MNDRPVVFAHRGFSQNARENTIRAFELAQEAGVDGIELDIWQSGDGRLVVHHDPCVEGIPIQKVEASELPDFVPTLPAALDACASLRVNIEIKSSDEEPEAALELAEVLIDTLTCRSEPLERWLVSSFNHEVVDAFSESVPEIPTALLFWEMPWMNAVQRAVERGHQAIHPHESVVDKKLVEVAKEHQLQVHAWTVNDLERANQLAVLNVDGLITDIPDNILKHLGSRT